MLKPIELKVLDGLVTLADGVLMLWSEGRRSSEYTTVKESSDQQNKEKSAPMKRN